MVLQPWPRPVRGFFFGQTQRPPHLRGDRVLRQQPWGIAQFWAQLGVEDSELLLHIIPMPLQQGLEAGMGAERVPGQFFTDGIRAPHPWGEISVRG